MGRRFAPPALESVVAFHNSGQLLRRLPNSSMSYGVDAVERELAFWGDVDAVEVRHPTESCCGELSQLVSASMQRLKCGK